MRDFLILWAALIVNYGIGYWRGRADARTNPDPLAFPEHLPAEFKAWLSDYIAVNTPRKES